MSRTTNHRAVAARTRPSVRPRLEPLEDRCVPAVGVFNEDFSDDATASLPGFDTIADGTLVANDLPRYGSATEGPTGRLGYYSIEQGNPGDPGWGLHADGHVLTILSSNFGVAQATFTVPAPGSPGGPDADEEVTGIGISVQGFGRVIIVGTTGHVDFTFNSSTWQRVAADRDDLLPSGEEVGTILRLHVYSYEYVALDNVSVQIGRPDANDLPIATDDVVLVNREFGQSEIFNPLDNDFDPDGDALHLVAFTQPARGTVTQLFDQFGNSRGFTYHANADALADPTFREDSFTYIIDDAVNGHAVGTVRLVLNTPPIALFDEYELPHNFHGPFDVGYFGGRGVLDNDVERDGDALTVTAHGQPRHGTVTLTPDGGFRYVPSAPDGRVLPDSFTYEISDGYFSAHGEVFILVPNAVPATDDGVIAAAHDAATPLRGSFPTFDADGDALTAVLVEDAEHGHVTRLEVVNGRMEVEYETAFGVARGPTHFSYRLFDGYDFSDVVTVEIRVPNHAPVAHPDFYFPSELEDMLVRDGDKAYLVGNVLEGIRVWAPGNFPPEVFASIDQGADRDLDGDLLQLVEITELPRFGTLVSSNADGDFVYELPRDWEVPPRDIPNLDYDTIIDSFRYRVSDGVSSSETTVYLYRYSNTRAIYPLKYEVTSGETLFVPREIGLTSEAPDHFPWAYTIERLPRHGTLRANGDGSFHYEPEPGFVGRDDFLIQYPGSLYDVPRAVTIVVRNDAPEPRPDRYWARGDQDLFIGGGNGVLTNDGDPNGHLPRLDFIGTPAHGQIIRSRDDGSFTYRPDPGFRGTDTFQYQVSDVFGGVAVSTITVEVLDPATAGAVVNVVTPSGHRVALQSSPGTTLANVDVLDTPPGSPPADVVFPLGYFRFEIHGVTPGGAATVRVLLPADAPPVNEYWKFGPTLDDASDHWYRFVTSAPAADFFSGVIVDPGGPALVVPPTVKSVVVNDGRAQRSMVNRLTLTFGGEVTLDPGAFVVRDARGTAVGLTVSSSVVNGRTVAVLTFRGRGVVGGSLADGSYTLVVRGDRIHDRFGQSLRGDAVTEFFRRYGDADGDGDIDGRDRKVFKAAWGSTSVDADYRWYLDYDLDGDIDKRDKERFRG